MAVNLNTLRSEAETPLHNALMAQFPNSDSAGMRDLPGGIAEIAVVTLQHLLDNG